MSAPIERCWAKSTCGIIPDASRIRASATTPPEPRGGGGGAAPHPPPHPPWGAPRAHPTLQGGRRARQLRFALGGLAQLLGQRPVLARPLLLHPIDSLAHLLQLRANRRERVEDGVVPGRARLGMLDPAGQFLRARLPSGGLRAKRAELVARL